MQGPTNYRAQSKLWLSDYVEYSQVKGSDLKLPSRAPASADKFLIWDDVLMKYSWVSARHILASQISDMPDTMASEESVYSLDTDNTLASADDEYLLDCKIAGANFFSLTTSKRVKLRFGEFLSIVTDADGSTSWDFNTDNTITAGGAADANLRELFRVRNNGTEAFQVYASGVAYAAGGIWAGKRLPTDSRYPSTLNRFVYDSSDGEHHTLFYVEMANLNATVTNKNHIGADFRIVYQPGTATQTGIHRGVSLFFDIKDSGVTNTLSSAFGGFFSGRFNGLHTVTPMTCTLFQCGSFEFSDLSDPASLAVMTQIRYVSIGGGAVNNAAVTTAYGIYLQDLTAKGAPSGPTNVDAIRVLEQDDNGAALKGNINMRGGAWNNGHFVLKDAHIWFDGTTLFGKTSPPTGPTDGTDLLGGGSGGGDSLLEWMGL